MPRAAFAVFQLSARRARRYAAPWRYCCCALRRYLPRSHTLLIIISVAFADTRLFALPCRADDLLMFVFAAVDCCHNAISIDEIGILFAANTTPCRRYALCLMPCLITPALRYAAIMPIADATITPYALYYATRPCRHAMLRYVYALLPRHYCATATLDVDMPFTLPR